MTAPQPCCARRPVMLAAAVLAVTALAACGGSDSSIVRPPSGSPTIQPSTPSIPVSSAPSSPSTLPRHPKATVRPATGLRAGEVVDVSASGFSPGRSLIVVQCADKGKQTGAGDCNLAASVQVQADDHGRVSTPLTVTPGPFGGNGVVCSAKVPCLISITDASPTPTEEADTPIRFK